MVDPTPELITVKNERLGIVTSDEQFIADVQADLRTCSAELGEKRATVLWIRKNSATETAAPEKPAPFAW